MKRPTEYIVSLGETIALIRWCEHEQFVGWGGKNRGGFKKFKNQNSLMFNAHRAQNNVAAKGN